MRLLNHRPNSVAIVGMGPSIGDMFGEVLTQEFTMAFADEVWAINMASNLIRSDVIFWMDDLSEQEKFKPGLMAALRHYDKPVITSKAHPEIVPKSYDYPLDEVARLAVPVWGKPYLNNGVAQAVGYAIHKGVSRIKLYGCDFSYPNRDYAESGRACVESWITLACIKNIEVQLCPKTSLFDAFIDKGVYGYRDQPEITLADGSKWQFQAKDIQAKDKAAKPNGAAQTTADGHYVPEDSSGAVRKEQGVHAGG